MNLSSKALTPLSSTRLLSVNQANINRSNTTVQIQPIAQHSPQTRIHVRLRSAQVVEAVAKVTLVSWLNAIFFSQRTWTTSILSDLGIFGSACNLHSDYQVISVIKISSNTKIAQVHLFTQHGVLWSELNWSITSGCFERIGLDIQNF